MNAKSAIINYNKNLPLKAQKPPISEAFFIQEQLIGRRWIPRWQGDRVSYRSAP